MLASNGLAQYALVAQTPRAAISPAAAWPALPMMVYPAAFLSLKKVATPCTPTSSSRIHLSLVTLCRLNASVNATERLEITRASTDRDSQVLQAGQAGAAVPGDGLHMSS